MAHRELLHLRQITNNKGTPKRKSGLGKRIIDLLPRNLDIPGSCKKLPNCLPFDAFSLVLCCKLQALR